MNTKAARPAAPIQIVITVEGGLVGSVLCNVPARITLIDFDNIEAGNRDLERWHYDAANAEAEIAEAIAAGQAAIKEAEAAAEEQ